MDITVAPARLVLRAKVREPVFIFHTYNILYIHTIIYTYIHERYCTQYCITLVRGINTCLATQ